MNKRSVIQVAVGIAVLVGIGWFFYATVDFAELMHIVSGSNWVLLLATIPVILASHVLRATRWRRLLAHTDSKVSIGAAFSAIMIGYAANTIIPRIGEVLRPYALSRRTRLSFPAALSSVVVERVLDVLTLLAGIAAVLYLKRDAVLAAIPELDTTTLIVGLVAPIMILATGIALIAFTNIGQRMVMWAVRPMSASVADKLEHLLAELKTGAGALRSAKRWPMIIVDSAAMWTLYIVPIVLILSAMPWSGTSVGMIDGAVLLVIIAIGVTVAPTPGALGVYQTFAQVALVSLYGATAEEGLAFGILAWTLNYGVALVVGGLAFVVETRRGLNWRDASAADKSQESGAS